MSWRGELAELLGEDVYSEVSTARRPEPERRPLVEAARSCPLGSIVAAVDTDGTALAVARLGSGRLVVLADSCPHDGGLLSDGFVEGARIVCARHGWEFDGEGHCLSRQGVRVECPKLA